MQWSYPELRRRLIKAELWPEGRMARLACYLAAMAVVLFALQKLLGLFAPAWGDHLGGWVGFLVFLAAVLFSILAFRWLKRQNSVAAAQPPDRHLCLHRRDPSRAAGGDGGLLTLYGLAGQFASFVVTSETQRSAAKSRGGQCRHQQRTGGASGARRQSHRRVAGRACESATAPGDTGRSARGTATKRSAAFAATLPARPSFSYPAFFDKNDNEYAKLCAMETVSRDRERPWEALSSRRVRSFPFAINVR